MLSHVHIGVTDFQRAFAFYSAVMGTLGFPLKFSEQEKRWAAWKPANAERPLFLIGQPYNGAPATPGNGQIVCIENGRLAELSISTKPPMMLLGNPWSHPSPPGISIWRKARILSSSIKFSQTSNGIRLSKLYQRKFR